MNNGTKKYNICVIPAGFSGCAWWRIRNPLELVAKKHPDMNIHFMNSDTMTQSDAVKEPLQSDLIIFQCPGSEIAADLILFYKEKGKKIIVEYDDYSFDPSPYNPRYKDLGIKEVMRKDKENKIEWIWKDGFNGFDLKRNIRNFELFQLCCKEADAITVTTDYLAKKFTTYNKNIYVLPNSIDFNKWKYFEKPAWAKEQIRIGWFGGDSHFKDLEIIKPIFKKVIEKYSDTKWVFVGSDGWKEQLYKDIPENRMETTGWNDLRYYPLIISTRFWDIGICPLELTEFNYCKSNIKWQEFGALKTPSVCTDCLPYNKEIKNFENGVLTSNEQFEENLCKLIENKDLRESIGDNTYKYIKEHYDLWNNCSLWYECYKNIIESSNPVPQKKEVMEHEKVGSLSNN